MIPLSEFPTIDAALNATSALLLTLGYFFIRRKRTQAHGFACFRPLQPPRFFSATTSRTTLTTVSRASPDKVRCAIFTLRYSVRTQFSRWHKIAARRESEMDVPYSVMHCKLGHRTQFPQSTIEPPFAHRANPSKSPLSATVSCCVCSRLDNQVTRSLPSRIGTEDMVEYQTERPVRGFVREPECDEKDCCTPLRGFAPRNGGMSREEIERDVSTWEWDELHCPSGPLISRSQNERSDSA